LTLYNMPLLRANALRSFQASLRFSSARATARATASARTQLVAKRFASSGSGGHGDHAASSDIPWMIGALVVTPASMWYLWPAAHDDHHEAHGHEEHAEEHAEEEKSSEEEKPSEEDQSPEDEAPQAESAPSEQADKKDDGEDKSSGSDSEGTVEKEGAPDKDPNAGGVQFKGKVAEGSAAEVDERKSEPRPSKGSRVKRIDSGLGKNLGEGPVTDEDDSKKESQATSKETSTDQGDITAKQKGLSTTDTRHSLQIDQDPEKSKKGSGEPETAKAKGTVDPKAPVR